MKLKLIAAASALAMTVGLSGVAFAAVGGNTSGLSLLSPQTSSSTNSDNTAVATTTTTTSTAVADSNNQTNGNVSNSNNQANGNDSGNNNGNDRNKVAVAANVLDGTVTGNRFGGEGPALGLGLAHGGDVSSGDLGVVGNSFWSGIQTANMNTGQGSLGQAGTSVSANSNVTFQ
jgi:hypothetical protein